MKKLLFLFPILLSSLALSMEKAKGPTEPREILIVSYMQHVYRRFHPTTQDYINQNPEAPETKILDRYVYEVVITAFNSRKLGLPLDKIGNEYWDALQHTPADQSRLSYILTGIDDNRGCGPAAGCTDEWKVKLKEIEDKIAKK